MIKFNFHMLIVVMSLQRVVLPRVSILVLLLTSFAIIFFVA